MTVSNLKELQKLEKQRLAIQKNEYTIACKSCKRPLWQFEILGWNGGDKMGTPIKRMTSFEGVGRYDDYWDKTTGQPTKVHCPFCAEEYFTTVQGQDEHKNKLICVPYCPELD